MKRKTLFKRLIALGLTAVMSLPAMVAVNAESETDTANGMSVAADLSGKNVIIDGVLDASEGWTKEPTLTIDSVKSVGALKMWLGTDGNFLYGYMEIQHGAPDKQRLLEAQFDFVNSHDETNEDGTAKWTKDTYRQMLGKELVGAKSAWLQFDIKAETCYAARQYKNAANEEGSIDPSNSLRYLKNKTQNWKTVSNDCAIAEFKIDLPDSVSTALRTGNYTIGVGGAYCYGWSHTQHDTAVHGSFPNKNNAAQMLETLEPALLKDVVLPATQRRAANMVGKTVKIDGVRSADEGWTEAPTLTGNANGDKPEVRTWLGTDGEYFYLYSEMSKSAYRFLEVECDFLNTDAELNEDGSPKWTKDTYRQMLSKEKNVGEKSFWLRWERNNNGYYGMFQYRGAANEPGYATVANGYVLSDKKVVFDNENDLTRTEIKIKLPEYVKTALKTGIYSIGIDAIGAYNWEDLTQYTKGTLVDKFKYGDNKEQQTIEPASLPDVILPCTSAPVGQLLGTQAADMGETYGIRFLATTDNKTDYSAYQAVGFDFMLAGKTKKVEKTCEFVYDSVTADYGATTVSAKDHGANYIYACTIERLAKTGTYTFTVTPWTLAKGEGAEKAYGTAYTVVYTDGAFVSATPVAAN